MYWPNGSNCRSKRLAPPVEPLRVRVLEEPDRAPQRHARGANGQVVVVRHDAPRQHGKAISLLDLVQEAPESPGLVLELERRFATPRPVVGVADEPLDEHSRPPWHRDLLPATPPHFSYLRTWHLLWRSPLHARVRGRAIPATSATCVPGTSNDCGRLRRLHGRERLAPKPAAEVLALIASGVRCEEHENARDRHGYRRPAREREMWSKDRSVTPGPLARVGLALGSGSARGWAHIGVVRALEQAGVRPELVCGTSIGSLVGAAYAAGELDRLEQWARSLRKGEVIKFLDVSLGRGLVKGERIMSFLRSNFRDRPIEDLALPFAAVATSLENGAEVWLRRGSTLAAVRASIAIPGLLAPVRHDGSLLVDGGLVNPVPVSLARAMGADFVIAVDLNSDIAGRYLRARSRRGDVTLPSPREVLASSINVMQVRITRSRLAGEPPDLLVTPRLAHFGLFDYHRAEEGIEEGKRAVERVASALSEATALLSGT